MKRSMMIGAVGVILITILTAALVIASRLSISRLEKQNIHTRTYDRHYVMISTDQSELWQSVFQSAKEQAEIEDVYLEWIGQESPAAYSAEECMEIAVSSGVDGILLHPDETGGLTRLVDEAAGRGIPVITLLEDLGDSGRVSYIGVNSYQRGELYGKQVLQCLKDKMNHIVVLTDSLTDETNTSLLYSQMLQTIEYGNNREHEYDITLVQVDTTTSFDAEEDIRDLFVMKSEIPDILICMDLISTECVSQALVDYNEVGNVTVIGSFASRAVFDALEKGILHSTISVDTAQMGQLGISSLNEYVTQGYVSDYVNMGLEIINQKNVGRKKAEFVISDTGTVENETQIADDAA